MIIILLNGMTKRCSRCKIYKNKELFYTDTKICKICSECRKKQKQWRIDNEEYVIRYNYIRKNLTKTASNIVRFNF